MLLSLYLLQKNCGLVVEVEVRRDVFYIVKVTLSRINVFKDDIDEKCQSMHKNQTEPT